MNEQYNNHLLNLERMCFEKMEVKWQKAYEILIAILIFFPIIMTPILIGIFNKKALGILVIVLSITLIAILVIVRKRLIKSSFYKVKNAEERYKVIEVRDLNTLHYLYETSALTIIEEPEKRFLNILYNWLNSLNLINCDELSIYTFKAQRLKKDFNCSELHDECRLICISLKDLNINKENEQKFFEQHFMFGRWLDDIIKENEDY